jgi:ABC-type multidrug transport system fused ATPase/permease subunit
MGFSQLVHFVKGRKVGFLLALAWGFFNQLIMTVGSALTVKYLIDEGVVRGNLTALALLGLASFALGVTLRTSGLYLKRYQRRLKNLLLKDVCLRMLDTLRGLPYRQALRHEPGYFAARIFDDARTGVESAADALFIADAQVARLLGGVGVAFFLSWELTVVLAAVTGVLIYWSQRFGSRVRAGSRAEQEHAAELRGLLGGVVAALKELKLFDLFGAANRAVGAALDRYAGAAYRREGTQAVYEAWAWNFMSAAEIMVLTGAGYAVVAGALSFGGLMTFIQSYWFAVNSVQSFLNQLLPQISQAAAAVDRLREVEGWAAAGAAGRVRTAGEICLKGVSFAYAERPVLSGLTLNVRAGERVLVRGPNGSGKSTLGLIIAGLLEPDAGEAAVPARVSAALEPVWFPPVPVGLLVPAGKAAEAQALFERFGLSEVLDRPFEQLSLGQKKKLALALALLKEADCYIFDEPLANLDPESVRAVGTEVNLRTAGRTLVIIQHGPAGIWGPFDRVVELGPIPMPAGEGRVDGSVV